MFVDAPRFSADISESDFVARKKEERSRDCFFFGFWKDQSTRALPSALPKSNRFSGDQKSTFPEIKVLDRENWKSEIRGISKKENENDEAAPVLDAGQFQDDAGSNN